MFWCCCATGPPSGEAIVTATVKTVWDNGIFGSVFDPLLILTPFDTDWPRLRIGRLLFRHEAYEGTVGVGFKIRGVPQDLTSAVLAFAGSRLDLEPLDDYRLWVWKTSLHKTLAASDTPTINRAELLGPITWTQSGNEWGDGVITGFDYLTAPDLVTLVNEATDYPDWSLSESYLWVLLEPSTTSTFDRFRFLPFTATIPGPTFTYS